MTKKYESLRKKVIKGTKRAVEKAIDIQIKKGKKPVVSSSNSK